MRQLAVYGSLLEGFGNNGLLRDSKKLSSEVVDIPFKMISLGGFPGLIPAEENHNIYIEVWGVDDRTYSRVEILEGYPSFYQKSVINTSLGECEVYVLNDPRYQSDSIIEHGSWAQHYKRRYETA